MDEKKEISEKLSKFIKTNRSGETLNANSAAEEFITDIFKHSYKSSYHAEKNINMRKISSRSWEKYLKILKNRSCVLYSNSEGEKLKRTENLFILEVGKEKFGSIDRYDEIGLIAYSELYSLKYDDFCVSSDIRFALGKHCIQRILERNGLPRSIYNFNNVRNLLFKTLKYAPLISSIINHFLIVAPIYNADSIPSRKLIIDVFSGITIPIPTENGLIFSNLEVNDKLGKPILALRTYFSDEMLSTKQAAMKCTLNSILSGFEDSYLIFLAEMVRVKTNDSKLTANMSFANFFTEALMNIFASKKFSEAFNLNNQKHAKISTLYRLHVRNVDIHQRKYFEILSMATDRETAQKVISVFVENANKGIKNSL